MTRNNEIRFRIRNMTCNHCIRIITKATESAIPGTNVTVDLKRHIVTVSGLLESLKEKATRRKAARK